MNEITRNRTIRPSTRLETSKSYKINTKNVSRGDILVVNIDHESKPFHKSYKFNGADVAHKDSISFRVTDFGTSIDISWSGATPLGNPSKSGTRLKLISTTTREEPKTAARPTSGHSKTSFEPISDPNTEVLILGTMPGNKSLELGEYYGHPRNRFWKIISTITTNYLPQTYLEKRKLLLKSRIGIWDVAHKAIRKGSLDSAIKDELPND